MSSQEFLIVVRPSQPDLCEPVIGCGTMQQAIQQILDVHQVQGTFESVLALMETVGKACGKLLECSPGEARYIDMDCDSSFSATVCEWSDPLRHVRREIDACGPRSEQSLRRVLQEQWSDSSVCIDVAVSKLEQSFEFYKIGNAADGIYWTNAAQDPS